MIWKLQLKNHIVLISILTFYFTGPRRKSKKEFNQRLQNKKSRINKRKIEFPFCKKWIIISIEKELTNFHCHKEKGKIFSIAFLFKWQEDISRSNGKKWLWIFLYRLEKSLQTMSVRRSLIGIIFHFLIVSNLLFFSRFLRI